MRTRQRPKKNTRGQGSEVGKGQEGPGMALGKKSLHFLWFNHLGRALHPQPSDAREPGFGRIGIHFPPSTGKQKGRQSLRLSPQGQKRQLCGNEWKNNPSALPCPSPGSLSHTALSHPPNPKDAGYLTPGCVATVMPGRGVGIWPEAALIREWRDGGRRFQGDVGFGEGWPRWARFLRQREAKALGGRRAATVRAEERISRSQTVFTYEAHPRPEHRTPTLAWQSSRSNGSPLPVSSTEPLLPTPPHCSPLFQSSLSTASPSHQGFPIQYLCLCLLCLYPIWPLPVQTQHGHI